MSDMVGAWLTINEYSNYKKTSVSTIRRHIKNKILKVREENGKYLIYVPSLERVKLKEEEELLRVKLELQLAQNQIKILNEEVAELKMLVALYENKNTSNRELPPEFIHSV